MENKSKKEKSSPMLRTSIELNEIVIKLSERPKWKIEEMTGYKPFTTFWEDFSIADNLGISAVEDTFNRAFKEWQSNYKYLTELILVLNWKIWQHYETNDLISKKYDELWRQADEYACENLKGEALNYYYSTTD